MSVQEADGLTCTGERLSGSHGFIDTLQEDRQMTELIFEAGFALTIIIAIAAVFFLFNKMRERKNGD